MAACRRLVELSGLPFGLFSDMLGGDCTSASTCVSSSGPNPHRGMIFGMTSRFNEPGYQGVIWRLWDEFNIRNSTMIGPFDAHPAVTVHHHTPRAKPTASPSGASAAPPTNWSGPYRGYIAGCAGPGPGSPPPPCASETTLGAAERACDAMSLAECGGVTKAGNAYQLRQKYLNTNPNPGSAEVSWARNCAAEPSSCPVHRNPVRDPVQATAYVQKGVRALIVLASFGIEDANVTLTIDWAQLGLDAADVKTLRAPALGGFQPHNAMGGLLPQEPNLQVAREFELGESILVEGARGWFLLVE